MKDNKAEILKRLINCIKGKGEIPKRLSNETVRLIVEALEKEFKELSNG